MTQRGVRRGQERPRLGPQPLGVPRAQEVHRAELGAAGAGQDVEPVGQALELDLAIARSGLDAASEKVERAPEELRVHRIAGPLGLHQEMGGVGGGPRVGLAGARPQPQPAARDLVDRHPGQGAVHVEAGVARPGAWIDQLDPELRRQIAQVDEREGLRHDLLETAVRIAQELAQPAAELDQGKAADRQPALDSAAEGRLVHRCEARLPLAERARHLLADRRQIRPHRDLGRGPRPLAVAGGGEGEAHRALRLPGVDPEVMRRLPAGADVESDFRGAAHRRRALDRELEPEPARAAGVVAQHHRHLQTLAERQHARQRRRQDQRVAHPHQPFTRAEAGTIGRHRHHPERALEIGHLELGPRLAPAICLDHAGPEGHRLDPPDALGAHVLRPRRRRPAAGLTRLHLGEEQIEGVGRGDPEGELAVEEGEGVGGLLGDELENAFVHRGHGDQRSRDRLHRHLERRLRARLGRRGERHLEAVAPALDGERNGAKSARHPAGLERLHPPHQGGGEIDVGAVGAADRHLQGRGVAVEVVDPALQHPVALDGQPQLAGERRSHLDDGGVAGGVLVAIELELEPRRVVDRPGGIAPARDEEGDVGGGTAREVADDDPVAAVLARREAEARPRATRLERQAVHHLGLTHRLVAIVAARRPPQHGLPALDDELRHQLARGALLALRADRDVLELHLPVRLRIALPDPPQPDVEGDRVHRDPAPRGDAAASRFFDPRGDDGGERRRRTLAGQLDAETSLAPNVEALAAGEDLAAAELAVRDAKHEIGVGRRGKGRVLEPHPHLRSQTGGRSAEEVLRHHPPGELLAAARRFALGLDLDRDAIGHELLDLETVEPHLALGDLQLERVRAGRGRGGDLPLELDQTAGVDLQPAGRDLPPVRRPVAHDDRHRRCRAQIPIAHQGHPSQGLARPVEVALAVDEGGVAGLADSGAGDVEPAGVDLHPVEMEEAEVVALPHHDDERSSRLERGVVAQPPEAGTVGAPPAQALVLVRQHLDLGPGGGPQSAARQRPHHQLVGATLGDHAQVGDQDPALRRLPALGLAEQHPVEAALVEVQVLAQRQDGGGPPVALALDRDRLVHQSVAQRPPQRAADPAEGAPVFVVLKEKRQVVVENPVDDQADLGDVDGVEGQVAVAAARQKHALGREGDRRRQVGEGDVAAHRGLERGLVFARQAAIDRQPVGRPGGEGADQAQDVALGGEAEVDLGLDPHVLAGDLGRHRGGEGQPQRRLVGARLRLDLAHRQHAAAAQRQPGLEVGAQRRVALLRDQIGGHDQAQLARPLALGQRAGAEADRRLRVRAFEHHLRRRVGSARGILETDP